MKKEYLNQDINNPKYLFHGSPIKLDKLKSHQSNDSNENKNNIDNAIFLTPVFLTATAYAFKDTIKRNSYNLKWNFEINNNNLLPVMKMCNVSIDENIIGYIYVFEYNNSMIKDKNTYQYKCYNELIPIDTIKVCFKDFSCYYEINNEKL